jgi:hypothetical protein
VASGGEVLSARDTEVITIINPRGTDKGKETPTEVGGYFFRGFGGFFDVDFFFLIFL